MTTEHFNEEVDQTETKIDEPWDHQFEKNEEPTTRSARIHANTEASLYTKIIFGVTVLLALVMGTWFVLSMTGVIGKKANVTTSDSKVPKLVIQSQTSASSDESASTTSSSTTSTTETTKQGTTETTTASTVGTTASTAASGTTYTVQAGDTLYSIARRYGLTVSQLQAINGLSGTNLSIGQVLRVAE